MKLKQYAIKGHQHLPEFLRRKRKDIKFFLTDADIIGINMQEDYEDKFIELIIEYSRWLDSVKNDKTINKDANGNLYHT